MILKQIKQYIDDNSRVSCKQLSEHFHMPENAIDAMIEVWVRKGLINKAIANCKSSSCGKCTVYKEVWYHAIDEEKLHHTPQPIVFHPSCPTTH